MVKLPVQASLLSGHPQRGKLLGLLVLVLVALGGVGAYLASNRAPASSIMTSTASSTSTESLAETIPPTLTSTTQISATASSLSLSAVQWITISRVRSVEYYFKLLESNGTQPYVLLGAQLGSLPGVTNATAVAAITYLALNATNPEVKEAFDLIINGGIPNQGEFGYQVPFYNTELQVLYWLAAQRQLKCDDTLALAISMSNGFWVTIGNGDVQLQVRKDVVDLLDFFRETETLQEILGYPRLEEYPLEAKVALAWLGGDTGTHGPHAITGSATKHNSLNDPINLVGYQWDNVNVRTLRQMRSFLQKEGMVTSNIDQTVANLEDYFLVNGNNHFIRSDSWQATIQVNGETVPKRNMNNANFNFEYFLRNGFAIGVCEDQMTLVSAFLKSWGVATLPQMSYWIEGNWYNGHTYTMYYDAASKTWKVNLTQLENAGLVRDAYIFIPPVLQRQWIPDGSTPKEAAISYPYKSGEVNTRMFVPIYNVYGSALTQQFEPGVGTAQMKQWVLYKTKPS